MNTLIKFNIPYISGSEKKYIEKCIKLNHFSGDGEYTEKCSSILSKKIDCTHVLMTTSCTHALELAANVIEINEGDEVIMPSYTFVSTANAFLIYGAKIVFVDIDPFTMQINVNQIENYITKKTKAIVAVNYGGSSCDLFKLKSICDKNNIILIEDAAQSIGAKLDNKSLGTIGHIGTFSFHETKNIQCGEGGAFVTSDKKFYEKALIAREKGTNRTQFIEGKIDKYTWVSKGSSLLPSELNMAFLYPQIKNMDIVNSKRRDIYKIYFSELENYITENTPKLKLHDNSHIFYIKCKNKVHRDELTNQLVKSNINCTSHYVPLHLTPYGRKNSIFRGNDTNTIVESEKILRLPVYFNLHEFEILKITNTINKYF